MAMCIGKRISLIFITLLLSTVALCAHADVVHKWVDAEGVTHYSDQLPEDNLSSAKQIPLSNIYSNSDRVNDHEDYYSITNQWARMREERIERKQLQLDKKKQKAAQKAANLVTPQVVYINQAEEQRSQSVFYPAYLGGHDYRNHKGFNHYTGKKYNNRYSNRFTNSFSGAICNLPRNSYSRRGGSGLSLTFR